MTTRIIDIHSHHKSPSAIYNLKPGEQPFSGQPSSAGIHPWYIGKSSIDEVELLLQQQEIIAVGECGLDRNIDISLDRQEEIFRRHIILSEQYGKPLIIHCVRCHSELLRIHKQTHPRMPWIIHGFRGRPGAAAQLRRAGIYYSLGERYNPQVLLDTPLDQILPETDEACDIHAVIRGLGITERQAAENIRVLFDL